MSEKPVPPLRVGDVLYGFCNGYFGRDSHDDKRVEAIGGDWVIARTVGEFSSSPGLYLYEGDPEFLCQYRERPESEWG
jgi:hypothetical protein